MFGKISQSTALYGNIWQCVIKGLPEEHWVTFKRLNSKFYKLVKSLCQYKQCQHTQFLELIRENKIESCLVVLATNKLCLDSCLWTSCRFGHTKLVNILIKYGLHGRSR